MTSNTEKAVGFGTLALTIGCLTAVGVNKYEEIKDAEEQRIQDEISSKVKQTLGKTKNFILCSKTFKPVGPTNKEISEENLTRKPSGYYTYSGEESRDAIKTGVGLMRNNRVNYYDAPKYVGGLPHNLSGKEVYIQTAINTDYKVYAAHLLDTYGSEVENSTIKIGDDIIMDRVVISGVFGYAIDAFRDSEGANFDSRWGAADIYIKPANFEGNCRTLISETTSTIGSEVRSQEKK